MAEDYDPRLRPEPRGKGVGDGNHGAGAGTLRHHDYRRALAAAMALLDAVADVVEAERDFRDHDRLRSAAERDRDRDKPTVTAHHLDAENSFVGECGVGNRGDWVERGVHRGIEADRIVGAGNIVVYRGRYDEHRNAGLVAEDLRPAHRTLASDDDQCLDLVAFQVAGGEATGGGRAKFRRARGLQESAAALNDVGDGAAAQRLGKIADKALVTAPEADHLDSRIGRGAC